MQSCFPAFWSNKTLKIDQVTRILGCPEKPKQKGNGVCSEASYTMHGGWGPGTKLSNAVTCVSKQPYGSLDGEATDCRLCDFMLNRYSDYIALFLLPSLAWELQWTGK